MTGLNYDLALFSDDLLPSRGLARRNDPETSQKAAQTISGRTEKRLLKEFERNKAYDRIVGKTADELCEWFTDIYPPTLVSALSRLKNKGLVVDSGQVRASRRGRDQTVLILRGH